MRVLVTGAAGFLGAAAVALLRMRHEVAASDLSGVGILPCDLGDRDAVSALVAETLPDVIVHCGAISGAMVPSAAGFGVNVVGTEFIAQAARQRNVRRVVLASSIAVYGRHRDRRPVPESAPLRAAEPYGESKIEAEKVLDAYASGSFEAVSLRISSVFGEGRRTSCLLQKAVQAWQARVPLELAGKGQVPRQLLHISDAARALVLAVEADAPLQRAYNISGGTYLPEVEVLGLVGTSLPGLDIACSARDPDDWPDGNLGPLDIRAAATDLAYAPLCDLRRALNSYVAGLAGRSGDPIS